MAKLFFIRGMLRSNMFNVHIHFRNFNSSKQSTIKVPPTKEIKIPVQWGHISAKVWGNDTNHRPILALHGWQDNAGTWDTLAPMLVKDRAIMAIDFPGHGLSSNIPAGMNYYSWDLPRHILYLQEYFKWDKMSIIAHSMGSTATFRFASMFPDNVDFFVGMDSVMPYDNYNLDYLIGESPKILQKNLEAQSQLGKEPPSYTMEQIKQTWHLATRKSVELESVQYLAKRGTMPSNANPEKFYYCRDPRQKNVLFIPEENKFVKALMRRVKCPLLYIKATDSPNSTGFSVELCELLEKYNPQFERHFVPGTHYVHLNNPERVVPLILNFFKKHNIPN